MQIGPELEHQKNSKEDGGAKRVRQTDYKSE